MSEVLCPDCGERVVYSSCQQPDSEHVAAVVLAAHQKFGCIKQKAGYA